MTATPERTDGLDVFELFDHNIAYEIRLNRAMDENMLCPFHYYGVTDIYVADNNSSDDSIAFLKTNFPAVKIVQNKVNGGFAKGYNDALKLIEADIYALVNSDIEVTENWLHPIVKEFQENAEFVRISSAGLSESHVHDVQITREAPNYIRQR